MRRVISLYRTSVGKKFYMAVSGAILIGFLVAHMVGNLKMYMGADSFNHYAEFLRDGSSGSSSWGAWASTCSRRGRSTPRAGTPEGAVMQRRSRFPLPTRWGGVIIGTFVIYHLLHFTVGSAHPEFVHGEAYQNVVLGFRSPLIVGFYILALVMVTFHVYHGLWSAFQTVGANHPKYNPYRRPLALVVALLLFLGFMTVPVGVMAGFLTI
jgi:succinate dehydrogenase / fumarate reductase cytochrome b subunit